MSGDGKDGDVAQGVDLVTSGEASAAQSAREERRERARARREGGAQGSGADDDDSNADQLPKRARRRSHGYEFSSTQNLVFNQLQLLMKLTAAGQLVSALVVCTAMYRPAQMLPLEVGVVLGVILALPIVVGIWTFRAAAHFKSVVDTRGGDIDHLMRALGELRKLYLLQAVLFCLAMALGAALYLLGADVQASGVTVSEWRPL